MARGKVWWELLEKMMKNCRMQAKVVDNTRKLFVIKNFVRQNQCFSTFLRLAAHLRFKTFLEDFFFSKFKLSKP
jgi:hypothetical protein